jgi:hypothetical protein
LLEYPLFGLNEFQLVPPLPLLYEQVVRPLEKLWQPLTFCALTEFPVNPTNPTAAIAATVATLANFLIISSSSC